MKILLICASMLIIIFTACHRGPDDIINNTNTGTEGTILEKLVILDTSRPHGLDTESIYNFHYDSHKRVDTITTIGFKFGTHNIESRETDIRYYTSNDTVPYLLTSSSNVYANGIVTTTTTDTLFMRYDNNDVIVWDSIFIYEPGNIHDIYVYNYVNKGNGKYYMYGYEKITPTGPPIYADTIYRTTDLVTGNFPFTYDSSISSFHCYDVANFNYNYDTHLNPFNKMALHYPAFFLSYDPTGMLFNIGTGTKNNLVGHNGTEYNCAGSSSQTTIQLRYAYNNEGYPISIVSHNVNNPSADYPVKELLFYKQ